MSTLIRHVAVAERGFDQVVALFDDYRMHYGQDSSPGVTRDWLEDQVAHRRMTVAAAFRDDQVCGFITTSVLPASLMLGEAWSIRDLFVAAPHRRRGVASTLLRFVLDDARAAGACRVSLQTESDNLAAIALYTTAGFQPVTGLDLLNLTLDDREVSPGTGWTQANPKRRS